MLGINGSNLRSTSLTCASVGLIFYSGCAIPGVVLACGLGSLLEDFLAQAMAVTGHGVCIGWHIVSAIFKTGTFVPSTIFYMVYIAICIAILCFTFIRGDLYDFLFGKHKPVTFNMPSSDNPVGLYMSEEHFLMANTI